VWVEASPAEAGEASDAAPEAPRPAQSDAT
jgi:hypothetical protein